jgi:hypothetical protein
VVLIGNSIAQFNGANFVECPFQLGKFFALPAELTYDNLRMEAKWVRMGELPSSNPILGPVKYYTPNPVINHPDFKMVLTRKRKIGKMLLAIMLISHLFGVVIRLPIS